MFASFVLLCFYFSANRYLQLLLRRAGHTFHTSAELEIVRQIKEDSCYVAVNAAEEEKV